MNSPAIYRIRNTLGLSLREAYDFYMKEPSSWSTRLETKAAELTSGKPATSEEVGAPIQSKCLHCQKDVRFLPELNQWVDPADTVSGTAQYCFVDPVTGSKLHEAKCLVPEIDQVRNAINEYYAALDRREHGGIAQNNAFYKIEKILGMNWEPGRSLR